MMSPTASGKKRARANRWDQREGGGCITPPRAGGAGATPATDGSPNHALRVREDSVWDDLEDCEGAGGG